MMFERFTDEARALVALAVEHAIRLGHRYVGGEHILLAAVTVGQPASAVLRAHGVTPELVEEEIVRRVGLGAGAGLFGGLDKDALATIGIDLDAVRARIEASFGPQALARAAQAAHRDPRRRRPGPRPPRLVREWRRRRRARRAMTTVPAPGPRPPEATGRYCAPGPRPSGHIPFTPASKKILELTLREADALHDSRIGVEHIALALTTIKQGLVPQILSEACASAAALRTAILDRYRRAS
jgi:ATP-dependent Clp protease ATP-binding subunit ClpA